MIVTTPPHTHYDLCKLSLEAGKHVVVEKPFTPSQREANQLITLAKKEQRLLTVYQNRRWDSDFLALSRYIEEGYLGRIVEFETHFDRHRPNPPSESWKTQPSPGTGATYDLGVHLLDQIVTLFGLPKSITGFLRTQRLGAPTDVHDSFTILLHYDNGLVATAKAGVVGFLPSQLRFRVLGEKGSYVKDGFDSQEKSLKEGLRPGDEEYSKIGAERQWELNTDDVLESFVPWTNHNEYAMEDGLTCWQRSGTFIPQKENYLSFYQQFAQALAGQGEVPVQAEEARDVIRLIELATLSSEKWMTLDWDKKYEEIDW